jgi:hypothetical protein
LPGTSGGGSQDTWRLAGTIQTNTLACLRHLAGPAYYATSCTVRVPSGSRKMLNGTLAVVLIGVRLWPRGREQRPRPAPPPRTAAERLMEMVLSEIRAGVLTLSSGSGPFRVVA